MPIEIGLDPAFTIHDREDSADLMNLVRHELGFSKLKRRFPTKGTCLAIYSRCVNAELPIEEVLGSVFPWCAEWATELKQLFGRVRGGEAAPERARLRRPASLLAQAVSEPALARRIGERFDHVLVDEYQDTNRLQASILLALKPDGRGLTVVGDDAQAIYSFRAATVRNILDFPATFQPPATIVTLERNYRSTQPILAAANGVIDLAGERFTKNLWTERTAGERPQIVSVRDETDQASYVAERILENREGGHGPEATGGALPRIASQRTAGARAHPPQHPLRQVRRPEIPRRRAREGRSRAVALCREPAGPCRRVSVCFSFFRESALRRRRRCSIASADASDPASALIEGPRPQGRRRLASLRRDLFPPARGESRMARGA